MVVDRLAQVFPTHAPGVAPTGPVAGDAMTDPIEFAELLGVDVDDFARSRPLMAANRLSRLQRLRAG